MTTKEIECYLRQIGHSDDYHEKIIEFASSLKWRDFSRILKLFKMTNDFALKDTIAWVLHETKNPKALPHIIREIKKKENKNHTGTLLYACEVFDCSKYVRILVDIIVNDDGEAAMTAGLVLNNVNRKKIKVKERERLLDTLKEALLADRLQTTMFIDQAIAFLELGMQIE